MKFRKVFHCNLDKLIDAYTTNSSEVKGSDINVKYFSIKDYFYFKTLKISYYITGVSGLDIMNFINLGANVSISSCTINLPYIDDKIPDIQVIYERIYSLYESIESVDKNHILPVSYKKYDVVVEFTGMSLINLLGINPLGTLKITNGVLPTEKVLSEILFDLLYEKFYICMNKTLEGIDLLTDVTLQRQYYKYVDSKDIPLQLNDGNIFHRSLDIGLACIETSVGSINFLDTNKPKLMDSISIVKSNLNKFKESIYLNDNIEYLFVLETDFDTFLYFYNYTNFVINHEDLKFILFNGNRILHKNADLLEVRLVESANQAIESLKEIYKKELESNQDYKVEVKPSRLEMYEWFCGCTQIKYMLKIKESDLDKINKDFLDNQRSNIHQYVVNEYIKGTIEKIIKSFRNMI